MHEIAKKLCTALKERSLTVTTAESCTGGMIAGAITSVPGSSDCFGYGFVTYANEAKSNLIGVKADTLKKFGAVSPETAKEMAEGALGVSGADIAVAVTGIAGPGGATVEKPVGLVYISVASKCAETKVYKNIFDGNRDEVRHKTVVRALELVFENIIMR